MISFPKRLPTIIAFFALVGFLPAGDVKAPVFKVDVDLVVSSFTVTDNKGRYISGLKPGDIRVYEDGVEQNIRTFSESRTPSSIFILFDTSNCMYSGFVHAQDAIASFIRDSDPADSLALYTFSRNLSRAATLTLDKTHVQRQLRDSVAGDDTAVFNTLLLTLRDAAKVPGRKAIVVFSNGPDNASVLSPHDVSRVAEDEGIPVYAISTQERDAGINAIFERIGERTGGRAFFASKWQKQIEAFAAIRRELANTYSIGYYPAENANRGYRSIRIEVVREAVKKCRVSARAGYHPRALRD